MSSDDNKKSVCQEFHLSERGESFVLFQSISIDICIKKIFCSCRDLPCLECKCYSQLGLGPQIKRPILKTIKHYWQFHFFDLLSFQPPLHVEIREDTGTRLFPYYVALQYFPPLQVFNILFLFSLIFSERNLRHPKKISIILKFLCFRKQVFYPF